ncbi:hypothetical protein, variant [Exophiala oligosperma]|uniref:rhomboid protease n=1 Tax=Exophiala oligosperma TaxID=215243 RepID=A0A0D2DNN3_9EURO|nr:hypothetical protein, variant [Exophiala oligosperma]KIW37404.1 hypothetical protein, variant [Exophiala oligosperma]
MAVPQQQPRISTNSLPLPNARFFFVNPSRVRSYLLRLPLFTRLILLAIVAFWLLELQTVWSVTQWGALIPKEVGFGTMYRLNTFPLIHMGFFHMLMDTICLVPLLERFEAEWGTLTTLALFMGPLGQIPAVLYLIFDGLILRDNTPVLGSSVWVFLLLAAESIKTYRANPHIEISGQKIPTWITPLAIVVVTSVLIPNTSFLGHLSGCITGYLCEFFYFKTCDPNREKRLTSASLYRGTGIYTIPGTTGKGPSLDRGQTQPPGQTTSLCFCRPKDLWKIWCFTHELHGWTR